MAREKLQAYDIADHRKRAGQAWADKSYWQGLYDDAYAYAIPYRKPAKTTQGQSRVDNLFDDTAISSTFHGAGQLKEDLFPSGAAWFTLAPGPISKAIARNDQGNGVEFARQLQSIADQVTPFFQTGEFDQATTEYCIDLYAGTGVLLPVATGDPNNPVGFVAVPQAEIACEVDGMGKTSALYWKKMLSRRHIKASYPNGTYPKEFEEKLKKAETADEKIEICQDFIKRPDNKRRPWALVVYIEDSKEPIVSETYRTQPIVVSRYHRVPGEAYGRGPILNALPAIKTLNKAQELTLKATAIKMLGIWGYRPGGAFNPDAARLAPGQFWPMNSTGGVMGPDVFRLDQSTGDIEVGNLVSQDLRQRIQVALHDERLPEKGATPISASEVAARMARVKTNYIGAFGRMVHETIPVLVPRVMEILYDEGLLSTELKPDALFVNIRVLSPLAAAMRADGLRPFMEYLQLLMALQQNPARFVKIDDKLDAIAEDMNIEPEFRVTVEERAAIDQQEAAKAAQAAVTQALVNKPEIVADAMGVGKAPAPAP